MDLTDANFQNTVDNNDLIILDFWAAWCGPCQAFAPVFEKAAEEHPEIVFGKVNTEIEQKLSIHFGVRSIPTVMIIREGVEVFSQPGSISESQIHELIAKTKTIDMEEVNRQIDEEEAKAKD